MKNKKRFCSLNRKLLYFGIFLSGAMIFLCLMFLLSSQYLSRQQNRLLHVQEAFSSLTEDLNQTDSKLYAYAQSQREATKEEILRLSEELTAAHTALARYLNQPIFQDLSRLTQVYQSSVKKMFSEETPSTGRRLELYQDSVQDLDIIQALMGEYRQAVVTDRILCQERLEIVRKWTTAVPLASAALLLIMSLWILRRSSRRITENLELLTERADKICQWEWDISVPQKNVIRDEVDVLAAAFYQMQETIQEQIEELKAKEALERKLKETEVAAANLKAKWEHARLCTLQSRVNPHFLFNALNVIGGSAAEEGASTTLDMISETADYLRYSLSQLDKEVSLEEEFQNIRDYLSIQKRRFGKRLTYSIFCVPEILEARIPSMILQPLVENALIHGIMPKKEGGEITVEAYLLEGKAHLLVTDNGLGFTEERRMELEKRLEQEDYDDAQGVGLYNVMERLRAFFDRRVSLNLQSDPGQKTTMELILPAYFKKTREDEDEKSYFGGR